MLYATATGMSMLSIAYAMETVNIYNDERWDSVFSKIQTGFAVTIMLAGIPLLLVSVLRAIRARRAGQDSGGGEAGYVQSMFNTVATRAFSFTFILLLFTESIGTRLAPEQSADFFLNALIAVILTFFSLSFWFEILNSSIQERRDE